MRVPWMEKEAIARQAEELITGYEGMIGATVIPPIPVEDMIERFLGLDLTYEDLDAKLEMENVLGATYVDSKRISIHKRLLEDRNEGRLVFTCGHEAGHWVLHRHLLGQQFG